MVSTKDTMERNNWYAVTKGRNPGIYSTWPECREQVMCCAGEYKAFATYQEAVIYLRQRRAVASKAYAATLASPRGTRACFDNTKIMHTTVSSRLKHYSSYFPGRSSSQPSCDSSPLRQPTESALHEFAGQSNLDCELSFVIQQLDRGLLQARGGRGPWQFRRSHAPEPVNVQRIKGPQHSTTDSRALFATRASSASVVARRYVMAR